MAGGLEAPQLGGVRTFDAHRAGLSITEGRLADISLPPFWWELCIAPAPAWPPSEATASPSEAGVADSEEEDPELDGLSLSRACCFSDALRSSVMPWQTWCLKKKLRRK